MYDKVRAHREALKELWFSLPHEENKKEMKVITITTHDNWFVAKIITDVADCYTSTSSGFRTLEEATAWVKLHQDEAQTKYNLDTELGKKMAGIYDYHNYQVIYN